jgi:hypothetical protein
METDALSLLYTEQDSDHIFWGSGSMSQIPTPQPSLGNSAHNEIDYTHLQRSLYSHPSTMYMCDMCHDRFQYLSFMNMHVNSIHPLPQKWKCDYCCKIFMNVRSLCRHKSKEHKNDMRCKINVHQLEGDRYRCSECFQGFSRYEEVESHMKNMHDAATPKMYLRFHKKRRVWNFITKCVNYVKSKISIHC